MVSFRLFVAGRSVDPDHRHYRCLLPHLEACRMADAALSGVGGVRGVSESGGVVAEPIVIYFCTRLVQLSPNELNSMDS